MSDTTTPTTNSTPMTASTSASSLFQEWLLQQCSMISDVSSAVIYRRTVSAVDENTSNDTTPPSPILAILGADADAARRLARLGEQNLRSGDDKYKVFTVSTSPALDGIACPVMTEAGEKLGLVIELSTRPEIQQRAVINLLQWGVHWLCFALKRPLPESANDLLPTMELVTRCLDQEDFQAQTNTLLGDLAARYRCERVSLGLRKGKHIEVQAMSHTANFKHKTNMVRDIAAAMDEALDQDKRVNYSVQHGNGATMCRAHNSLSDTSGKVNVLTVPMSHQGEVFAAITLERNTAAAFGEHEAQQIAQALMVLSGVLSLQRKSEASVAYRLWNGVKKDRGVPWLKIGAAAITVLVVLLAITPAPYKVASDAVVEGLVQRMVAAPVDGFIADASVRAGDVVEEGAEMGRLDDKELKLAQVKWSGEREKLLGEYREALAKHDRSQVSILSAQTKQAEAQLALVQEQLARTRIIAPFSGVVIDGDLSQSLGAPVSRGDALFTVAPLEAYRILVKVDEQDIAHIRVGQGGDLRLASFPGDSLRLKIEKITSVASTDDGQNYFRVEASLLDPVDGLLPGMEGIAKVAAGEQKLLWIWTHSLVDWLRVHFWRFF